MDSLKSLLLTTDGRISRKQWWIGVLCLFVVSIIASLVLGILAGGNTTAVAWFAVLINLALLYPTYCIGLKRRHDRNNDGKDVLILLGGSVVINLLQASAIGATAITENGLTYMVPPMWMSVLVLVFAVFAIYMFIQLGFLKGSHGTNNYGADPVNAAA
ncbi:DUF805 domain-containing protein [Devosia sp. WQ 349]|uniref:DUF805 domain-containing protein n=1 Tax=Devosia sp. WQ 349K1 TaxID=2800329 RepID=UPI001902EE85|nr:DUF805 domain-containing protein [Devosia sp. WQ 349K1]MBK1796264.1 DUF805 domain-containing protein [Devosia sp. WQ 349K1]